MSDFVVMWDSLAKTGDTFEGLSKTMYNSQSRLQTVKSNLAGMSGFGNLSRSMDIVISNVEKQGNSIKTIGQSSKAIALLYKLTEHKISGTNNGTGGVNNPGGDNSSVDWNDGLWEILSNFGITGKYASMVNDLFNLDFVGAAGTGVGIFGELLDNACSIDPKDMRSLLFGVGVDDAVAAGLSTIAIGGMKGDAAKAAWKEIAGNYKFGDSVGKNIAVGAQWAMAILDNGIENYEEFGTMANARFWGETAVETGVDVLMGVGATAAVTAGAVALGVAAPAVAVAAVAGGVVWGINTAVEHFTGKDVGEWAADAVCDGAEWVADKVGDGLSSAKDAVCKWLGI